MIDIRAIGRSQATTGKNVPQVIGQPLAVVPNNFDMHADPTSGIISANISASPAKVIASDHTFMRDRD